MNHSGMSLQDQLQNLFDLQSPQLEHLNTPVNDVVAVTTRSGKFALKIYNSQSRTDRDVAWELELIAHLAAQGAPVIRPVRGKHDYIEKLTIDGQKRVAALFEWAPGEKPKPGHGTYVRLGEAAARIHAAADTFKPSWMRETYDAGVLIDEQIERMKAHLLKAGRYDEMLALGERLKKRVADPGLDQGICHMDLTLDNIHEHDGALSVFDFDSSGWSWRAIEPWGVLRFSQDYFNDWLKGYRVVRPFSAADEQAVAAFGIIGDIRNVVWKLGEAVSSRGKPLLTDEDLPQVIDDWRAWEREMIR